VQTAVDKGSAPGVDEAESKAMKHAGRAKEKLAKTARRRMDTLASCKQLVEVSRAIPGTEISPTSKNELLRLSSRRASTILRSSKATERFSPNSLRYKALLRARGRTSGKGSRHFGSYSSRSAVSRNQLGLHGGYGGTHFQHGFSRATRYCFSPFASPIRGTARSSRQRPRDPAMGFPHRPGARSAGRMLSRRKSSLRSRARSLPGDGRATTVAVARGRNRVHTGQRSAQAFWFVANRTRPPDAGVRYPP